MPAAMIAPPALGTGQLETLMGCVRGSIEGTFAAIYGSEPTLISRPDDPAPVHGVIGMISFVGDLPWSFMLGLPKQSALTLTEKFTGFELEFESIDMADVVGELANVVAGDMVARLYGAGICAEMSLPTVARGHDVELLAPENQQSTRLYFESAYGPFWVRITTSMRAESATDRKGCCPACGR